MAQMIFPRSYNLLPHMVGLLTLANLGKFCQA